MTPATAETPSTPSGPRTPRRRAARGSGRANGVYTSPRYQLHYIKRRLERELSLPFSVSDEQATMLQRIDQCYDGFYIAGTGYGKSLIIEGTACLNPSKVVIVICPLKALEYDQVAQAKAKGLKACTINEDLTTAEADAEFAAVARGERQLVYISPELSLTERITNLLGNPKFRRMLKALFVDEAHVIAEWAKKFREAYGFLGQLRSFTGQDIPFVALSATVNTATFDTVWKMLRYGFRPFFGMDLGVSRRTLVYLVARKPKVAPAVMAALSVIPEALSSTSSRFSIPKSLFYLDQISDCMAGCQTIDRCLPSHMRASTALPYSSAASAVMKQSTWDTFSSGTTRILCATDAAGMGCNVGDIEFCAIFDVKARNAKSDGAVLTLPKLSQRWGRTGRHPDTPGVCVLFAPDYAFLPTPPPMTAAVPTVARLRGRAPRKKKLEPASWTKRRQKLPESTVTFLNLAWSGHSKRECAHRFMEREFRPETGLTVYSTLDMSDKPVHGERARNLRFEAIWLVLDVRPLPPPGEKCGKCWVCNPELLDKVRPISADDVRFRQFKGDFLRPLRHPTGGDHADEAASNSGAESDSDMSAGSVSIDGQSQVPPSTPSRRLPRSMQRLVVQDDVDALYQRLMTWRRDFVEKKRGLLASADSVLPDTVVRQLCKNAEGFAALVDITTVDVQRRVTWQLASADEMAEVVQLLKSWVSALPQQQSPRRTPASARRPSKRARVDVGPTVAENLVAANVAPPAALAHGSAHGPFASPATPSRETLSTHSDQHLLGTPESHQRRMHAGSPWQPATPTLRAHSSLSNHAPRPPMLAPLYPQVPASPLHVARQLLFSVDEHAFRPPPVSSTPTSDPFTTFAEHSRARMPYNNPHNPQPMQHRGTDVSRDEDVMQRMSYLTPHPPPSPMLAMPPPPQLPPLSSILPPASLHLYSTPYYQAGVSHMVGDGQAHEQHATLRENLPHSNPSYTAYNTPSTSSLPTPQSLVQREERPLVTPWFPPPLPMPPRADPHSYFEYISRPHNPTANYH